MVRRPSSDACREADPDRRWPRRAGRSVRLDRAGRQPARRGVPVAGDLSGHARGPPDVRRALERAPHTLLHLRRRAGAGRRRPLQGAPPRDRGRGGQPRPHAAAGAPPHDRGADAAPARARRAARRRRLSDDPRGSRGPGPGHPALPPGGRARYEPLHHPARRPRPREARSPGLPARLSAGRYTGVMVIRHVQPSDLAAVMTLAAEVLGPERAGPFVRSHLERHHLLIADADEAGAREQKAFHEALRGLNEEQMTEVWLGTWSVKDIVAHMSGWHREMGAALERIARGERPIPEGVRYDDVDAWNAGFAAAARDAKVADVLLEFDKSHASFMHVAATVSAERYQPGKTAYKIVDLNSAHHYKEHGDQIRAWRTTRGI